MQPKKHKQNTERSLGGPGGVSTGQESFPGARSSVALLVAPFSGAGSNVALLVASFPAPGQKSHFWSLFFQAPGKKSHRKKGKQKRPKVHQKVDPPWKVRKKVDPPKTAPESGPSPKSGQKVRQNVDPSKKCARKPGWVVPCLLAILFAFFAFMTALSGCTLRLLLCWSFLGFVIAFVFLVALCDCLFFAFFFFFQDDKLLE